jgi:hypothetical protein
MIVFVLKSHLPDRDEKLNGIYSTLAKAKLAATGLMMHLDQMVVKPGKWTIEAHEGEMIYRRKKDGVVVNVLSYKMDKALLDGKFVRL